MRAALIAVVSTLAIGDAFAAPATVGVDLSKLDGVASADTMAIEQALIARLVQEGFAVVPLSGGPTIVLTITTRDTELVLSAKTARFDRSRTVDASGGTGSQLQLELVQKAVELARLAAESIPPPPRSDRELPETLQPAAPIAPGEPDEPRWVVGIDVGMLGRGGGNDVRVGVRARLAIWQQLGVTLLATGSRSTENGVEVRELDALIGPSYEFSITPRLAVEVAVLAGVRQHRFDTTMPIAEPSGDRIDGEIAIPVRLTFRPVRMLELSPWAIATLAHARAHLLGSSVLWHRDAFGVGVGGAVAVRF